MRNPPVLALDGILLWSFSLHGQGELFKSRANEENPPSTWLYKYAEYIEGHSNGHWRRIADPYAEKFGFPDVYKSPGTTADANQFAEFVYFHPFVEKILYENRDSRRAMELLVRDDVKFVRITLSTGDTHTLPVTRLQLFLFSTDLAILALQFEATATNHPTLDLKTAQNLCNEIRRVYPPFLPDNPEYGEAPRLVCFLSEDKEVLSFGDYTTHPEFIASARDHRRPPLAAHWQWLLQPLTPWKQIDLKELQTFGTECVSCHARPTALSFEQLGDERAYAMARIVIPDPARLPEQGQYQLAFLDKFDPGWSYQPDFLRSQSGPLFYDRFWHWGTRYMLSGFSFVQLASPGAPPYLRAHFQAHYFFLNLLAVLQKGSLLIFWDRLSNLLREYAATPAKPDDASSRKAFHNDQKWLAEDFADYLALFDFSEVSNQMQPLELFRILRHQMHIETLNKEVLEQLEYARVIGQANYERARSEADAEQTRQQTILAKVATQWLPVSLAFSFLGLSFGWSVVDRFLFPEPDKVGAISQLPGLLASIATALILAAFVMALTYLLFKRLLPPEAEDSKEAK